MKSLFFITSQNFNFKFIQTKFTLKILDPTKFVKSDFSFTANNVRDINK